MIVVRHGETVAPPAAEAPMWGGGHFELPAGGVFPRHRHDRHEEQIGVATGTVRVTIDEVTVELTAGDFLVVERGEAHELAALTPARGWFLKFPYLPDDRIDLSHGHSV